jgi:hypothetical protein
MDQVDKRQLRRIQRYAGIVIGTMHRLVDELPHSEQVPWDAVIANIESARETIGWAVDHARNSQDRANSPVVAVTTINDFIDMCHEQGRS